MKNKKLRYEEPSVEVILLTSEDILTTSNDRETAELEETED